MSFGARFKIYKIVLVSSTIGREEVLAKFSIPDTDLSPEQKQTEINRLTYFTILRSSGFS